MGTTRSTYRQLPRGTFKMRREQTIDEGCVVVSRLVGLP
jgi:hypothetical protein